MHRHHMPDDYIRTVMEPYKTKVVEPIPFTSRAQREQTLTTAHYNMFNLPAQMVTIDLLTDSGTGAMSQAQWAAMMTGDESYAGSASMQRLRTVVGELTGYKHVLPTHQGRAAEALLMGECAGPGRLVVSNTHFDTTRAHVVHTGADALDLPSTHLPDVSFRFKGNMDTAALEALLRDDEQRARVSLICMTITNNAAGGHAVSVANIAEVSRLARQYGNIRFFLDASRFAENAYFVREHEPAYSERSLRDIARAMFSLADGCWMSAKKDGITNIGGVLAFNDQRLYAPLRASLILHEGFPDYGGLAGRDIDALAVGLEEALNIHYHDARHASLDYLAQQLRAVGVPVEEPVGGHAVFVNCDEFVPHIPPDQFPAQAVACALYVEGGIRSVEIGKLMFGDNAPRNMLRLAVPRRVYSESHFEYVVECFQRVAARKHLILGLTFVDNGQDIHSPLRHFIAQLTPCVVTGDDE